MPRGKEHTAEEIIGKFRRAKVHLSLGKTQEQAAKQIGVTHQLRRRWRKEHGGRKVDQAKFLKQNARLKRLLADAELDKAILKEAASGNF